MLQAKHNVALSRVKSLSGLIIEDFKESAIFSNEKIEEAINTMPAFILEDTIFTKPSKFTIVLHNVQSLNAHFLDLKAHKRLIGADCICLTETWLSSDNADNAPQLAGFLFKNNPRHHCYDNSQPIFAKLQEQTRGGVGIYYSEKVRLMFWFQGLVM